MPQNHASPQYLYMRFSWRNKIPRCSACYGRKQPSGIRTMTRIGLKSWSVRPCPDTCRHAKCHPNPCTRFWVILLTDRQTARANTFTSSVVGGKLCNVVIYDTHFNCCNCSLPEYRLPYPQCAHMQKVIVKWQKIYLYLLVACCHHLGHFWCYRIF